MEKIYFENMLNENIEDVFYPTPAIVGRSDWWKNMPRTVGSEAMLENGPKTATIRYCPAINDSISFGYMLYFQTDLHINSLKEEIYLSPAHNNILNKKIEYNFISFHSQIQTSRYIFPQEYKNAVIKIHPGFGIRTSPGCSIWITSPLHRNDLPFRVFDAIVDADSFICADSISTMFKDNFEGIIKAGTPLAQIVPFKRENFKMQLAEYDSNRHKKNGLSVRQSFYNGYKNKFWKRKLFT